MRLRKAVKMIFSGLLGMVVVTVFIGSVINYCSKDRNANSLILEKLKINGSSQWISLSEEPSDKKKPVLLFLHGGPGSANISLLNQLCPGLREHAVIVNWDQRNSGKSYNMFQSKKSLTFEQNIEDAHALTKYLKEKFKAERISLMGFSAGTALGIMLADKYPDDYNLYIGVAQMVDGQRGEMLSLDYVLGMARKKNDKAAVRELERIHFDFSRPAEILQNTQKQRKFLLRYGGVYHHYQSYGHEMRSLWQSKEYSFFEFLFWPLASLSTLKAMWPEVVLMKMDELVPSVDIPVIFFSGVYDMNSPTVLVKEYYERLGAPKGKEFILFEDSAHGVFWDEPERFESETVKALTKYAK